MRAVRVLAFFVVLVLFWALLASSHIWDASLFPPPQAVGRTLVDLFQNGTLLDQTLRSLGRVIEGYTISLFIGVPLGVLLARSRLAEETVGTLVIALQSLPSICWLPLALLWFGLNDRAILFVVVMGSLVSIAIAVKDGVRNMPPLYVRAALTMGASPSRIFIDVLFPATQPAILTAAKLGWAYAWRALMSGELLFVSFGLGHALMVGRDLGDMSQVLSVMLVIMALGLGADRLVFGRLENFVRTRWGLSRL